MKQRYTSMEYQISLIEEVNKINVMEDLQLAVSSKFFYGWSELEDLSTQIPTQCNIKGDCKIVLLMMRFNLLEDSVNMMPKTSST